MLQYQSRNEFSRAYNMPSSLLQEPRTIRTNPNTPLGVLTHSHPEFTVLQLLFNKKPASLTLFDLFYDFWFLIPKLYFMVSKSLNKLYGSLYGLRVHKYLMITTTQYTKKLKINLKIAQSEIPKETWNWLLKNLKLHLNKLVQCLKA